MTATPTIPPMPPMPVMPLAALGPIELLLCLSHEARGAWFLLCFFAWAAPTPCTLDDRSCAHRLGITPDAWAAMRPQFEGLASCEGEPPRWRFIHALAAYQAAVARHQRLARASAAGHAARWGHDPGGVDPRNDANGMPMACDRHADRIAAPIPPPHPPSSSGGLQRSRSSAQSEANRSSAPPESARDVIGILGAGARAQGGEDLAEWRTSHARAMLTKALAEWRFAERTKFPVFRLPEWWQNPNATPAMVAHILSLAESPDCLNPVGMVMRGLGLVKGKPAFRPDEIPIFIAQKWAELESKQARLLQLQAQAREARRAAQQHNASNDAKENRHG